MFVLPNAWDAGSAYVFEKQGFGAVATSSAGADCVFIPGAMDEATVTKLVKGIDAESLICLWQGK